MSRPADASASPAAGKVAAAAERAARHSYGRLVALLAASTGDLALAEDAPTGHGLADAAVAAYDEAVARLL